MKSTKNILTVLLAILVLVAGGILVYSYYGKENSKEPVEEPVDISFIDEDVDPETQIDEEVQAAGRNYTERKNEDNTNTRTFTINNTQYLTEQGSYKPIDTTVVTSASVFDYENTSNTYKSYFNADSKADDLIKLQVADRSATFSFIGANESEAVIEDNTVTFADIYDGLDANYTITGNQFMEKLIVEKEFTLDKISQKIMLEGVYYKEHDDGSITFHSSDTKKIVWTIAVPVMYEQEDTSKFDFNLHYEVEENDEGYIISKVIDPAGREWLNNANYPVIIDPTVTFGPSGLDIFSEAMWGDIRYHSSGIPPWNHGLGDNPGEVGEWRLSGEGSGTRYYRTFLNFETSSIPDANPVRDAKLHLWLKGNASAPFNDWYLQVYSCADYWARLYRDEAWDACGGNLEGEALIDTWVEDTEKVFDIDTSSVSVGVDGKTQVALRLRVDGGDIYNSFRGAYIHTQTGDQYEATLEVTYEPLKPSLSITVPSETHQLDITLTDLSTTEDSWYIERSTNGDFLGEEETVCLNMSVNTTGTCYGDDAGEFDTYDCTGTTQGGTGGTCILYDRQLTTHQQYYYRAFAADGATSTVYTPSALNPVYEGVYMAPGGLPPDGPIDPKDFTDTLEGSAGGYTSFENDDGSYNTISCGPMQSPSEDDHCLLQHNFVFSVTETPADITRIVLTFGGYRSRFGDDDGYSLYHQAQIKRDTTPLTFANMYYSYDTTATYHIDTSGGNADLYLDDSTGNLYLRAFFRNITQEANWGWMHYSDIASVEITTKPDIISNPSNIVNAFPNAVAYSAYSAVVDGTTMTAPITGAPTVESNIWWGFKLTAFPSGIPASTSFCVGAYFQDWPTIPSPATRYAMDVFPPDYYLTATLPLSDCHTQSDWALLGIPTTPMPIIGSWDEGRGMYPNRLFEFGLYSINIDGLPTEPTVKEPVYTRARNPAGLTASTPAAPAGETQIELTLTPESLFPNPSFTEYSIQADSLNYVDTTNAPTYTLSGTEDWADINSWGSGSTITVSNLDPATCYNFRSHVRNQDGVIGEDEDDASHWVNSSPYPACTLAAQPDPPDADCNYEAFPTFDDERIGRGYFCDITVNDSSDNPAGSTYYQIQRRSCRANGSNCTGWSIVQGWSLNTSWSDDNLTCSEIQDQALYQYSVRAANSVVGGGASSWSDISNPGDTTAPDVGLLPPCPVNLSHFDNPICERRSFEERPGPGYSDSYCLNSEASDPFSQENEYPVFWYWDNEARTEFNQVYSVFSEDNYYCMAGLQDDRRFCESGRDALSIDPNFWFDEKPNNWLEQDILQYQTIRPGTRGVIYKQFFRSDDRDPIRGAPTLPNTEYTITVRGVDKDPKSGRLRMGALADPSLLALPPENSAYTHFETPKVRSITNIDEDSMRINVYNPIAGVYCSGEEFCNLGGKFTHEGIQFRARDASQGGTNAPNRGGQTGFIGEGDNSHANRVKEMSVTESNNLGTNRRYCYDARGLNGDAYSTTDNPGDNPDPKNLPDYYNDATGRDGGQWFSGMQCAYTLSKIPHAPRLIKIEGETDTTVIINENDGNPHQTYTNEPGSDTRYAMCVTKYDVADQEEFSLLVNPTTYLIGSCGDPSCNNFDDCKGTSGGQCGSTWTWNPTCSNGTAPGTTPSSYFDTYASLNGSIVTGLENAKYDFSLKTKNGDNRETAFGPAATLFLVKNNVVGWAWSVNAGWLSLNCLNQWSNPSDYGYSCDSANDWGLNTFFEEVRYVNPLEGYAWSGAGRTLEDNWAVTNSPDIGNTNGYSLDYAGGNIWLVTGNNIVIKKIRTSDLTVLDTYNIGSDLRDIIYDGTYLWVSSNDEDIVYKLDPAKISGDPDFIVDTIDISGECAPGACEPWGLAYDGNDIWVANAVNNSVTRFKASDGTIVNTYNLPGSPGRVHIRGQYLWVPTSTVNGISRIDMVTGAVDSFTPSAEIIVPRDITSFGDYLWITREDGVTVINDDGTFVNDINLTASNDEMWGIAYNRGSMWVSNVINNLIYQIDEVTQQLVTTHVGADHPKGILPYDNKLWVANWDIQNITEISLDQQEDIAGVGWVSLYSNVCQDNTQVGCYDDDDCTGSCVESAGLPPDGMLYGYCYDQNDDTGLKYGTCSDAPAADCTEQDLTGCDEPSTATCIYETCMVGSTCAPSGTGIEECRTITTANFNGITREIEGYARILSKKEEGENQSLSDWGWINLNGQYDDGSGNVGNYNLTGTEIDSQEFLGDPDVNPMDVQLYSLFGWAWNSEQSSFSDWLDPTNVSQTGVLPRIEFDENFSRSTLVLDSIGDPHITWPNLEEDGTYNIYYLKLKGGKWVTVTGEDYQPGLSNPSVNVTSPSEDTSHTPILALDSNDNPHIAWVEEIGGVTYIYYLKWNSGDNHWESASGEERISAFEDGGDPTTAGLYVKTGSQISMVLDRNDRPHIAYRGGGDIIYRWWDSTANAGAGGWVDVNGGIDDRENVSNQTGATMPRLVLSSDPVQIPHIVWIDGWPSGEVYYRRWHDIQQEWVTASNSAIPGSGAPDLHVNWDVSGFPVPNITGNDHGENADIALYSDGEPGIVWRDPAYVFYRRWDGFNWVSVSGFLDNTDVWLNPSANSTYNADNGKHTSVVIKDDRPYIAFSDRDVHFRYWDDEDDIWVSADGIEQELHNDEPFNVTTKPLGRSVGTTLVLDKLGNMHLAWSEQDRNDQWCGAFNHDAAWPGSARDIKVDSEYMYVTGVDGNGDWHIEKRRIDNGRRDGGFGISGRVTIVDGFINANLTLSLDIDSQYMYLAGMNDAWQWRIEKRRLSNGTLCTDASPCDGEGFGDGDGTDGDGIIEDVIPIAAFDIAIDDSYMYVTGWGDGGDGNAFRTEKRRLSDGTRCTEANPCDGIGFGYHYNAGTGVHEYVGDGASVSEDQTKEAETITIDSDYMYVGGYDRDASADLSWRIEKRRLSDGSLVNEFDGDGIVAVPKADVAGVEGSHLKGISVDSDSIYAFGTYDQGAPAWQDWRLQKRDKVSGVLEYDIIDPNPASSGYAIDIDNDYAYTVGDNWGPDWRMQKHVLSDGTLCTDASPCDGEGFGDGDAVPGDGIVNFEGHPSRTAFGAAVDDTYMYVVGDDDSDEWRIEKFWKDTGVLDDNTFNDNKCVDPNYPQCIYWYPDYYCMKADINYTKWFPGTVQSGLGWVSFMPAGALLGIPWVQTMYADIFSGGTIELAPPPRGSGQFTATYLILADGTIQGIPGHYTETETGPPTSGLLGTGLEPLIEGAGQPLGANVLSRIDRAGLIDQGEGINRYGHTVDTFAGGDLSGAGIFSQNIALDGKVYHITGDSTVDNTLTFDVGNGGTSGNGTIIIDGDLEINTDIKYEDSAGSLADISELPSVAILVYGNVYVNSLVDELAGVFVVIDDPNTIDVEGKMHTSKKKPVNIVTADSDDRFVECPGAGACTEYNNTYLKWGLANSGNTYRTFMRWAFGQSDVDVPPGSEIKDAYIKFNTTTASSPGFTSRIYLINENDFDFGAYTPDDLFDITTSNSISYEITSDNYPNSEIETSTPNIKALIQRYVNSDEYANSYYSGSSMHLGLIIKEGDAELEEYAIPQSGGTATPPELVIEYSPRRITYSPVAETDDASAWGTGAAWSDSLACMRFGWYTTANRTFIRFSPDDPLRTLPANAEILESQINIDKTACSSGDKPFQARQALLDELDMPTFSSNPYNYATSTAVAEVAEDISTEWTADIYNLADNSRLIEAWIGMSGYTEGNSVGIRLRKGENELTSDDGAYREVGNGTSSLRIDYRAPLQVSGLLVAHDYSFDRKYSQDLAPAEQILYDGRVVANTPPGLTDFSRALPVYQKVTP